MIRATAWMLAAGVSAGLLVGCAKKNNEPPVTAAPSREERLDDYPEPVAPSVAKPAVAETASPPAPAPPVDTTATAAEETPSAKTLPKESYARPQKKTGTTHVVKKGDTLQKISKKYFGTTKKWRAIYDANRDVLAKGPDVVPVGTKLKIPK